MATANALLIDRREVKVHQSPVDLMIREMDDKYSLIILEGSRNVKEQMNKFKSGLYYLAKKRPDLELVPVYLDNMNRILPRGEVLPVPLLSNITIGIYLAGTGRVETAVLDRARQSIIRLRMTKSNALIRCIPLYGVFGRIF